MKIIFTLCVAWIYAGALPAQQTAQYSMYMFNKFAFNPAYAGLDNSLSLTGVYRNQWTGLEGHPVTQHVNVHMPLYLAGGGVGLSVENETIGSWKQTSATANYSYQMQAGRSGVVSLGAGAGLVERQLDGSKVRTPTTTVENGTVIQDDPLLGSGVAKGQGLTAHAGVFYQSEKWEAGISAINLLGNDLDLSTLKFKQDRTCFLFLQYRADLSKSLELFPSFLIKSDVQQTQMDFSLIARYNENIFVGGSFRGYHTNTIDAAALTGGVKLNDKILIGYSYDLGLSGLRDANNGSHEIMINYNLGKPIGKGRPPVIIYNPRSL